jgi:hypothetical protein
MLWYKSWLETRWRFLAGLAILVVSSAATVFVYPRLMELTPELSASEASGELGRRIREAIELSRSYRGYVWSQSFAANLAQMATLFAVLLGTGGFLSQSAGGLFTLSLPASRNRLLGIRVATGLTELFLVSMAAALVFSLLSPAIGQSYALRDALAHGLCLFIAGAVYFSVACLLSTMFADVWRPILLTCGLAFAMAIGAEFVAGLQRYSLFRVMAGEVYFRSGVLPWTGLFLSMMASAALLYGASFNFARRDF